MAKWREADINIDYVKLLSSERAALRAVKEMKGGGHTGTMTGGIVATSLVFFPAAPFFLFMHGKDMGSPKGTEITAYISGDMKLDIAKFQPPKHAAQPDISAGSHDQNVSPAFAKLQIESTPSGADIEVDGSFVGDAPSDLQVSEGNHTVVVKKSGFKNWERRLKSSAGSSSAGVRTGESGQPVALLARTNTTASVFSRTYARQSASLRGRLFHLPTPWQAAEKL